MQDLECDSCYSVDSLRSPSFLCLTCVLVLATYIGPFVCPSALWRGVAILILIDLLFDISDMEGSRAFRLMQAETNRN